MKIKILNELYADQNTYLIIENGEAIIIDPGSAFKKTMDFAGDVQIKYIFLTHCHFDHITSANRIAAETGAKICCSRECSENLKDVNINLTVAGRAIAETIDNTDIIFEDGDELDFNGNKVKVIKTPGHTSCSVCYYINNYLFTGDTLFYQNIGRWDFPTGNGDILPVSIKEKIYCLPDEVIVYPGHGRKTTVGYEKNFNLFVKG